MVEVSLTVGKLDASLALLLTKDHHLIEFPTILLPNGVKAGSIVKINCERDLETEIEEQKRFLAVQDEILETFGKNLPKVPLLKIKNVTQTSCVLEWDPLDLGTATLKSLTLFKDGKKLGAIPQPLSNRTTKLSGLPIEKSLKFQLKLDSTAGVYTSEVVEVTTHKMTDLSGIQVCLGDIAPNEQFSLDDIQQTLVNMGAHHPALDKMKVETTHFVTTRENKQNPEFIKANDMNVPIIRPEWLKACEKERRIVGVREFYVKDCVLPDLFARNYWLKPASLKSAAPNTNTAEMISPISPSKENVAEADAPRFSKELPPVEVSESSLETKEAIVSEILTENDAGDTVTKDEPSIENKPTKPEDMNQDTEEDLVQDMKQEKSTGLPEEIDGVKNDAEKPPMEVKSEGPNMAEHIASITESSKDEAEDANTLEQGPGVALHSLEANKSDETEAAVEDPEIQGFDTQANDDTPAVFGLEPEVVIKEESLVIDGDENEPEAAESHAAEPHAADTRVEESVTKEEETSNTSLAEDTASKSVSLEEVTL